MNEKILKEINPTFIALIPKRTNPSQTIIIDPLAYAQQFIKSYLRFWLTG